MNKKTYQGKIRIDHFGDNDEALFIGDCSEPFIMIWQEDFPDPKKVTVKYWISEVDKTKNQLKENQLLSISGSTEADYDDKASDVTGYLWTDQDLKIGGHDLYKELIAHVGKFLYMEVGYEDL